MRILKEGDRGEAVAPGRGVVPVVYEYRTFRLEQSGVDVPDVLVGVCEQTGEILAVPAQSTPKLKLAREEAKDATIQIRLPETLRDVLYLLSDYFGTGGKKLWPALLRFYLKEVTESERLTRRIVRLAGSPLASGEPSSRFAIRVSTALVADLDRLAARSSVTRSDLARGVIVAAKEDVLDGRARGRVRKLQAVAQAV